MTEEQTPWQSLGEWSKRHAQRIAEKYKDDVPVTYSYTVTGVADKSVKDWLVAHDKDCPFTNRENQGAIGGRITHQFTYTDLGLVFKAICACGAEHDASDYDLW